MWRHLHVHRQHVGAGFDEGRYVPDGICNHEVHVERNPGGAFHVSDDWRANGDVRHEMAVHDVDVNEIGTAPLGGGHGLAERGKISSQNRGGDADAHRLTSSEIGSPGEI